MQQDMPTRFSTISKDMRIKQLKAQIAILKGQLEAAERDLKLLQKSKM